MGYLPERGLSVVEGVGYRQFFNIFNFSKLPKEVRAKVFMLNIPQSSLLTLFTGVLELISCEKILQPLQKFGLKFLLYFIYF